MNTENRQEWYKKAEQWELKFCSDVAPRFGITTEINPNKEVHPEDNDLLVHLPDGRSIIGELKPNFKPFFMAGKLYSINPQYAFAFNVRDMRDIPEDGIVFVWLKFRHVTAYGVTVQYMEKVYGEWGKDFLEKINTANAPIHHYQRRVNDPVNAKCSYILDARMFREIKEIDA